jgi:hypothetical protein
MDRHIVDPRISQCLNNQLKTFQHQPSILIEGREQQAWNVHLDRPIPSIKN